MDYHLAEVIRGAHGGWVARCKCGWVGPERGKQDESEQDGHTHHRISGKRAAEDDALAHDTTENA